MPRMISASIPAFFRNRPKFPPQLEDEVIPVSGEREEISKRLEEGAPVPVRGPVAITMRLSSPKGVSCPVRLSYRILEAMALPPMYFSRSRSVQI